MAVSSKRIINLEIYRVKYGFCPLKIFVQVDFAPLGHVLEQRAYNMKLLASSYEIVAGMPTLGEQEGQEFPFVLNSSHLSYLLKEHFPAL